ncbi:hypothetical protein GGI07_000572 [Coemansia sp. Benny D115]|nr:hypothetical protein GGI07_000572 [Coemansia sp. Benny D115]
MAPRQKHSAAPSNATAQASSSSGTNGTSNRQTAGSSGIGSSKANGRVQKQSQLDFNSLNIQVLRKYRQVFKLNIKARSSKDDLVLAATRHYSGHAVDEVDTIARFLYTVHSNKGKRNTANAAAEKEGMPKT